MQRYYAVKQGRVPGVYRTWKECQDQISGYSNSMYHSFKTEKEARDYLNARELNELYSLDELDGVFLYSDGGSRTYNHKRLAKGQKIGSQDHSSWAYVIVENGEEITHDSGYIQGKTNQYEELNACYRGLQMIKTLGLQDNQIYVVTDSRYVINNFKFDYEHKDYSRKPHKEVAYGLWKLYHSFPNIDYYWVKGHQNTTFNNMCDELCTSEIERRY